MWKQKEYGRIYKGLKRVKRHRRVGKRKKLTKGTTKMEQDTKSGRMYSTGLRLQDEKINKDDCEEPRMKKNKTHDNVQTTNNNQPTSNRNNKGACKCGGRDHKRVLSKKCPWNGLSKVEVLKYCEPRVEVENKGRFCDPTVDAGGDPTVEKSVPATTALTTDLVEKEKVGVQKCKVREKVGVEKGEVGELKKVQSTSK